MDLGIILSQSYPLTTFPCQRPPFLTINLPLWYLPQEPSWRSPMNLNHDKTTNAPCTCLQYLRFIDYLTETGRAGCSMMISPNNSWRNSFILCDFNTTPLSLQNLGPLSPPHIWLTAINGSTQPRTLIPYLLVVEAVGSRCSLSPCSH